MATAYLYFALYFYHLIAALLKTRTLPRQEHRITSLQIRLQVLLLQLHSCAMWLGGLHSNL